MQLIDRKALLKAINDDRRGKEIAQMRSGKMLQTLALVLEHINTAPTIDPEELRPRGEWVMTLYTTTSKRGRVISNKKFACPECGYGNGRKKTNFCPGCGADMRGRDSE